MTHPHPRVEPTIARSHTAPRPRAQWSTDEDAALRLAVAQLRLCRWSIIAHELARFGRTADQCRAHWHARVLRAAARGHPWSVEEDDALVMLRAEFACSWKCIQATMPWRSNVALRNRFHVHCQRDWVAATVPSHDARRRVPTSDNLRLRLVVVAACLAMCAPLEMELL